MSNNYRFVPNILDNKETLELLKATTAKAINTDQSVFIMDMAASEFFRAS